MEMIHTIINERNGDKHQRVVGKQNKHKMRNTPAKESKKIKIKTKYP
jgi:hypothetical protein